MNRSDSLYVLIKLLTLSDPLRLYFPFPLSFGALENENENGGSRPTSKI